MRQAFMRLMLIGLGTLLLCSIALLYTPDYIFGYVLFICTCLSGALMMTNLRRLL